MRCHRCRTRLGVIWPSSDRALGRSNRGWIGAFIEMGRERGRNVHGPALAGTATDTSPFGIKNLVDEDWNEIHCPRCGHIWRGRDSYLHDLAATGGQVTLGQPVRGRTVQALHTTRGW